MLIVFLSFGLIGITQRSHLRELFLSDDKLLIELNSRPVAIPSENTGSTGGQVP
jgi:hypothetical protein